MRGKRALLSLAIVTMLLTAAFVTFPLTVTAGFPKIATGWVDANSVTGVRGWDAVQNGVPVFYIQNWRSNGTSESLMIQNAGNTSDYYEWNAGNDINHVPDNEINGDPAVVIVNREEGTWAVDREGYVASTVQPFTTATTFHPTCELIKIPVPVLVQNGTDYLEVTWPDIPDAFGLVAGYTLFRSTTNGSVSGEADWTPVTGADDKDNPVTGPSPTFNDTGLTPNTKYYYAVKVVFTAYDGNNPGNVNNYESKFMSEGSADMDTAPIPLGIDRIIISLSPDGSTGWIGDQIYTKYDIDTYYACGWNDTFNTFVQLVDVTWVSDTPAVGDVTTPGTSTTFTVNSPGTCIVTATSVSYGSNDTGILTVNPLGIDRIIISLSVDASSGWIGDQNYTKYDTDTFYACGWNDTFNEFVNLVDATWSSDKPAIGDVTSPGTSTTFTAIGPGWCIVTATTVSYGSNDTGVLYISPLPIDRIIISLSSDASTGWIGDQTYTKYDTDTFYACGWNDAYNEFVILVDAIWGSSSTSVGDVTSPGTSTSFSALDVGTCTVTATTVYGSNNTGILTVDPLPIDRIIISLSSDASSGWIGDQYYSVLDPDTYYACGWNDAYNEFVSLVDATWSSDAPVVGSVTPGPGTSTSFSADGVGTCIVIATTVSYGSNDTGILTVTDVIIDRIIISLSPDGNLGWIGDHTYTKYDTDTFYACGWNDTFNMFVKLVDVTWSSDTPAVGDVTTPGTSTSFSALDVGTCVVTATSVSYGTNDTGILTVDPLPIDRIIISLLPDASSGWIGDQYYVMFDTDTFYACGWNDAYNEFVTLVDAVWSSDTPAVGSVTPPGPGTSTSFSADGVGTCIVNATSIYGSNDTGILTVTDLLIDRIIISLSSDANTGWIGDQTYTKYDTDTFYACGWNDTFNVFVKLVDVTWSSDTPAVGGVTTPGTSSTFTANDVGTCVVTATSVSYGTNDTGILTVDPLPIDRIIISLSSDASSGWIGDQTYTKYDTGTFYACGWNDAYNEFVSLVDASWTSDTPAVGDVTTPGTSTTFTAIGPGTCKVFASHASYGLNMTGLLTVDPLPIDRIIISLSPDASTGWIGDQTYTKYDTDTFYACGWNDAYNEFVILVDASWSSDTPAVGDVTSPGTSTSFSALDVGTCVVTATSVSYGTDDTGILTVDPLPIDRIIISLSPDASTGWIGDQNYQINDVDTYYACGWNDAYNEFVDLVDATWSSDTPAVGSVTPGPSTSTTFDAVDTGTCIVTAMSIYGSNATGILTIAPPTIDEISIMDAPGGAGNPIWQGWPSGPSYTWFDVGDSDIFYAAGFNTALGIYVGDVVVTWSVHDFLMNPDTYNGTVNPASGISTTFQAPNDHGGIAIVRADYSGITNITNWLVTMPPQPDYIVIMDAPGGVGGGGNIVTDRTYIGGETDEFYAAGYNYTAGYIGDLEADWSSDDTAVGDVDTPTGIWSNFTAQLLAADDTCIITAIAYDIYSNPVTNTTGTLTVLAASGVDSIKIMDAADNLGNEVGDVTYTVYEYDQFWCAAFNGSNYLYDVEPTWQTSDSSVGAIDNTPPLTFTAQNVLTNSDCFVTATFNNGVTDLTDDTGTLTVLAPTIDYIQIRNGPNGTGSIVTTRTFGVEDTDEFYASGHNFTFGFISDVSAVWTSLPVTVGTVTSPGEMTIFEAQEVSTDSTCIVTASYGTITNETGLLTVLAPTIDEIRIHDAPNGAGNVMGDAEYNAAETDTFYAAGYNETAGYIMDVDATWESSDTAVGTVTSPGTSTTFTALTLTADGTCTVTATYDSISNSTGTLTVNAGLDITGPGKPGDPTEGDVGKDFAEFSWPANEEPDLDHYIVQMSKDPNGPWDNISTVDKSQTSYKHTGLDPDTTYYYRVIAVDDSDNPSIPSESLKIKTDPDDAFPWLLLILLIIIVVVILLIVLMMAKKKKPEEEMPPGAMPGEEAPMEEAPMEEEFDGDSGFEEGGEAEEYAPEETHEEEPQYEEAPSEEVEYEEEPQVEEEEPDTSSPPPPPPPPPA